jgi:VCBS repeat-containing protein
VKSQSHLIALEPRMMFDGAAVATAAATVLPDNMNDAPQRHAGFEGMSNLTNEGRLDAGSGLRDSSRASGGVPDRAAVDGSGRALVDTGDHAAPDVLSRADEADAVHAEGVAAPTSIIFIDTAVENYAELVDEWSGKGEIVLIDASRDGIDQMMTALAGRSGLESIHIVSHGSANRFMLGTTSIDIGSVQGELAGTLAAIGAKLSADGDILIYGCDVSGDAAGQGFIDAIAARTGADVAASSDATGAAALGGDWDLESRSGAVEAQVLISDHYAELLQLTNPPGAWTIVGNSASNVIDGVTVTITFTGTNAFSALTNDFLNNIAAFSNNAQTTADVATTFNNAAAAGITGTITITFSEAVTNPIINIDRLGGVAGTGLSNTSTLTVTTAGATLTKLAGPSHLTVGSTTISRQTGVATTGTESSLTNSAGTAAGSVRVNGTFTSLTFTVSGTAGDGFEISTTIDRSPVAQDDSLTINRGSTLTGNLFANNGSGADADPSGDAITVTRVNGATFTVGTPITLSNGTLTITNAATGAFTFVPNVDSYGTQTFTYTVSDASGGSDTATVTILVNDIPVLDLNSTPTPTNAVTNPNFATDPFAAGGGWTRTNANAVYGAEAVRWQVDAAGNSDMSQTVTGFAGPGASPTNTTQLITSVAWNNSSNLATGLGPGATLDIMIGGVTYARITTGGTTGGLTGTIAYFNGASGPTTTIAGNQVSSTAGFTDVTINLPNGIANTAALTYRFNSNGGGADFAIDNVRVSPLADTTTGRDWTASYTENGTPVAIADTDSSITDGDNANMQSATIVLTNEQAGDRFRIGGVAGTILANGSTGTINGLSYTVVDTGSTITIQLSGSATKAVYADTIESIFFESTSDNPGTTSRVINVTVNDGIANSNTAVTTISVSPVNDAPVNTLPASFATTEDGGAFALTGLSIADADANGGSVTVTLSIPAGSGTLNATGAGGVGVTGSGTNSIVLTGTVANINAYLAGAARPTFTQVADYNGNVTLTMTTNDGGNSGSGGALTDTDTRTIAISAVADIAADAVSVNEDTTLLISPLANDSFENAGAQITAVAGLAIVSGGSVAVPNGTVTLNASNQLVFTPAANFSGTSTFSYTVTSGGVTETANIVVTVNAVNDAPAGTDAVLTATEDTPFAFTAANFGFSDAVEGNAFAGVVITSVPANGTMLLNGVAVTAGTFVTAAQIAAGQLTWQGAANANGNGLGSFTFQVRDNGGTANGGQDTDQSPNTISFNVTAVNDAPVIGPATQTISYTENSAPAALFDGSTSLTDIDNANLSGATVTLGGAQPGDRLLVNGSSAASGTIGTISWTRTDTGVTFTGSATKAQYEAALRQVQFENSGDNPGSVNRTVTATVTDGALTSAAATRTVIVTPVNDQIVNGVPGGYSVGEDGALSLSGLSVADPDAASGIISVTLSVPAGSGTITAASANGVIVAGSGGASVVLSGTLADINAYLASATTQPVFRQATGDFNGAITLTMSTGDSGNTGGPATSDVDTVTITITPVVDIAADTASVNEDGNVTISPLANDSFENGGAQITAVAGQAILPGGSVNVPNGTVTLNASNQLVFTPAANFNGTSTFSYTVTSGGVAETANIVVTVNPVNDAPAGANAVLTATEDTPYAFTAANFGFSDIDGNAFAGVVITTLPANGALTLNGAPVTAGTFVTAVQIAGGQLVWTPAADANGTGLGSFTFQVRDDGGTANGGQDTDQSPNSISFNVASVNDAPVLDLNGPGAGSDHAATYTENAAPVAIVPAGVTLTDDGATMSSATVVLTNPQAGDYLTVNGSTAASGTVNGIAYTRTAAGVTLTGSFTAQQYTDALQLIGFANSGENPDSVTVRDIAITVNDGAANSNTAHSLITVTPVNDQIVNGVPGGYSVGEDGALSLSGLSVADPDAASGIISVTLSVPAGSGTITAASANGVIVAGSGGASVVLSGTLADINAYLASATTQPVFRQATGDFNGAITLTMSTGDSGNTGGPATSDVDTVTITITPVVDIAADTASVNEDGNVTISPLANDSFENGGAQITAVAGQAILPGGSVNVPNGTVTLNASNQLVFTPAANFNGTSTFSYTVTSGGVAETANVTVTVNAVNDTPTLTVPANVAAVEDTPVTVTGIVVSDIDAGSGAVRVTLSVPVGVLIWTAAPGVGVVGSGTGTVTLSGSVAAINAALAGSSLTYTPAANANGPVTLTTTINDQGNSGIDPGTTGDAGSEEASATTVISVAPVNDAPVAADDSFATTENAAVTFAVLGNDSDIDSATLTVTQINGTAVTAGSSVAVTGGSVLLNANGTLTFTPTTGFSGAPSFTYTISDGALTSTATVFGVVGAINHAPSGTDATIALAEDATHVFTAGNFGFTDTLDGNAFTGVVITTLPANGTMLLNGAAVSAGTFVTAAQLAAGQLTFTPAANANGSGLGAFTFQVRDNGGTANGGVDTDQSPNSISFTVASVNDAPAGTDAVLSATEDTPYIFTAGNFGFSDPADGNAFAGVVISTLPANGTLTLNGAPVTANSFVTAAQIAAGQLVWTSAADANGSGLGAFTFQVRDNGGTANGGVDTDQSPNSIAFTVAAVNDAPVAADDSFTVAEDTPATIDVRANDSDVDAGAVLTVTAVNGTALVAGGPGVAVTGGTVTLSAAGNLVFTPTADYNGPTSFSYTVRDENGATATATVNGTVTPVADPVTNIVPGPVTSAEDTAILFGAANGRVVAVTDPDNGTLTVTLAGTRGLLSLSTVAGLTFTGGDGTSDATMTFSGSAAAINAALDGLSFQPDADYNGPAQIAMTTTRAPGGAIDSDVIALTITPVADIVADTVTTTEDTAIGFNVLTGSNGASVDSFEDTGRTVTAVTQPPAGQGSVTFAPDGAIVFTPAPDFNGTTSFTYTVTSGGVTETATVTVNVGAANDAPTLDLDGTAGGTGYTATYTENGPGVAIIAANGSVADIDSAALSGATVVIANGSAGDMLSIAGGLPPGITASYDAATFTLTLSGAATPAAYKAALDAVRYASTSDNPATAARTIDVTVSDGALNSAPARATIAIVPVNDAPAGTDAVLNATEDTPYIFAAGNFGFSDAAEGDGFAGVVIATLPANGTLTLNAAPVTANSFVTAAQIAAGQLVWTPAADANGSGLGSFTFQVRDDGGTANGGIDTDASPNTISFTVGNVNDAPVSSDLAETIAEDGVLAGSLPGYTDADGDIATYRAGTTVPAHGTVTINPDGSYSYAPAADYNGTDVFSFIVDDGNGGTVEQYVTVTITPVNDAPVVTSPIPDRSQPDGASVSFDISGFFADAADGDPLSFGVSGLPAGLTMGANGLITGTIDPAASQGGVGGVYTVTVTASDGNGGTVSDTFSFTVTNPAPVAVDDAVTTAEDTPVTLNVLDGSASGGTADSDPDGDPLTVTAATAGNGTVTIGAGGAITYTPNADFNGTDTIVYTISDGHGGTAQAVVNVTVTPVNDAPATTPIPDRLRNDGDTVSFNTSTFFDDVDGNTLTYSATGLPPGLTIDPATGIVSGTIAAGASGPGGSTVYTITVTANDGNGGQSSITYRNTVVNIAPNASDDSATTNEDTAVDIPALANDSDPDGDTNFIVRVNNQPLTVGGPAVDTANGSVQLVDVGGVTMLRFTPDADYNGTESFTYTIDDGNSGINTAVVTIIVNPVNDTPNAAATIPDRVRADGESFGYDMGDFFSDPDGDALNYVVTGLPAGLVMNPATGIISGTIDRNASQGGPAGDGVYTVTVTAYDRPGATGLSQTRTFTLTTVNPGPTANNDAVAASEDTPVIVDVLGNDVDPDGDPLVVTSASAGHGAVVINGDGTLTYTPNADFNGTDTIIYTIDDGNGGTSSATVTVTVAPVNDNPTASPIPDILTSDDAVIDFDIGGYFSDVDAGTDLDFSFTGTLPPGLSFDPETGRISGTLTNDASANTPYVMTITADDGNGGTVSTTLTWNIQNLPPRAFADTLRLFEDAGPTSGTNILDNDVDPDNDGKVVAAINGDPAGVGQPVTGSAGGTFVVNADGTYTFDPGTAFDDLQVGESRTTVITYLLDDTDGGSDTGFITVTVDGTNDAPVAATIPDFAGADSQSITANPIEVASFFTDVEGDALTFSATGLPPGLSMDATGRITGTIDADASVGGPYTVVVTADDGRTTTSQSFQFSVSNPAPTAVNDNASTMEDTPIDIDVIPNDTDPDGDTLTIDPTFPPQAANGTVTINPDGTLHYVPNPDYNGVDTIIYRVTDGQGGLSTGVVNVDVGLANDDPVGTAIPDTERNDGASVSINISGYFSDIDGDTLSYSVTGLPAGLTFDPVTGEISGTIAAGASGPTGRADYSVGVTADDGNGGVATVTFTLTAVNIAPVANGDGAVTTEDTPVDIPVLANDTDADGDGVAVIRVNNVTLTPGVPVAVTDGTVTLVTVGGVQNLRFTPNPDFNGATTFSYSIGDGNGGFDDAVVSINVAASNDAPVVASPAPDRTHADSASVNFDISTYFSDIDGDDLDYVVTGLPPGLVYDAETGTISGTIASNASQGGTGGVYTVTLVASDPFGAQVTQSFDFTVTNPAPVAANDNVTVAEDGSVTFDPISGAGTTSGAAGADADPDGDTLTVTVAGGQPIAPGSPVTLPSGVLSMNADGSLTFTPLADFNGPVTIAYTVSDGNGGTADAVITIDVTAVNDTPTIDLNGAGAGVDNGAVFTEGDAPVSLVTADSAAFDVEDGIVSLDIALAGFVDGGQEVVHLNGAIDFVAGTATSGTITFGSTTFSYSYDGAAALHIENAAGAGTPMSRDAVTALIRALQYENRSDDPTAGDRSLSFTVTDADGATSPVAVATVAVAPVNDAPTSTPIADRSGNDADPVTLDLSGNFADSDGTLSFAATGLPPGLSIDPATGIVSGTIDRSASVGGSYSVTVTATDDGGASTQQSFVWTVANPAPTAVDDIATVGENGLGSGDVTPGTAGQDSDPDGDPLTVSAVNGAAANVGAAVGGSAGGSFTIAADGSYSFDPGTAFDDLGAGQTRTTSVTYTISDGEGGTSTASVTVTVTGANDAPVAGSLPAQAANDGGTVLIATASAFSDVDSGDTLVFSATGLPDGLTIDAATGEILGTLANSASQTGPYAIVVTATDAGGLTATAGFTLSVSNLPPVAVDDSASTNEDTPLAGSVATNDSDTGPDSDPLSYSVVNGPANGTLTLFADGRYSYAPNADFTGTDSFTYRVDDGNGGTAEATVTLTVTPVNDGPVAANDSFVTAEDTPVTFDVRTNDVDIDGPALTVTAIDGTAIAANQSVAVIGGSVTLNPDGTLTFTPGADYNGAPQFTYTVSDGTLSATATVTGTVTPVNDAPTASAPPATTAEDVPVSGQVTASDVDGDGLTYAVTTSPANGSVTIGADGSYTYTPNANFNGSDSFTVTVSDGNGGTVQVTIPVTVTPVNDAPVASALPATTAEDTPVGGQVTASDADGDPLTYAVTTAPANGAVTLNPDGSYTYTPNANFNGSDSFTVTVSDGNGGTALVTIPVTVTPVNDTPVASAPPATTAEDTPVGGQITATDVDGDLLTYAVTTAPANGIVTVNPDGSYTYTPNANFNGADSFTVTVSDGNGGTALVTIPVTVTPVNDAPVASAPPATTAEDTPVGGQITATDVDGDLLTYAVTTAPANGIVTVNPDGSYTYTPNANFNGADSFTVTVSDGNGGTALVMIPVTVTPVNDAPVASSPPATTAEDTPVGGQITATDVDGDALTYAVTTAPANGSVTVNPDGSYTYTPNANFNGADSFTVTVSDGNGGSVLVTIPVTVTPVNDAPVASAPPVSTLEDTPVSGQVTASDVDGDPLGYTVTTPPANGTVTINPDGSYTYTPNANFNGSDSFTVTVSDGNGGTALVTIPVSVGTVNDAPIASAPPATTPEDTPVGGQIAASDPDGDALTYAVTTAPTHGIVTVNPDGSYTYTPDTNFNGADSFTVTVSDGNGGTALVTIPVTVTPVNDAPVASSPPLITAEDAPVVGQVTASDADGDTLGYAVTTAPTNGTVTVNPDGSYTYTPNANFNGADSFTVTVSDGNGGTALVMIPVTVTPVNDAPVASSPPATTAEDTPVGGQITATDVDGDALTYAVTTAPANGSVTVNPDGSYTYTPNANFNGADSFTVTVSDGNGGTVLVTIPVTVTPVNDVPVASAPPVSTPEDTPVSGQVTASDADGDPLTYAVTTAPANGTVTLNPDGSYTYTPNADFTGNDSFTVTVSDGNGGTVLVTVPVSVGAVNDAPVASAPPATTPEDTPVGGQISASDADGDPLTYAVTTAPTHGSVTVNPDGSYTYTPDANFNGADSFTVTVSDGNGGTVLVTVPVTVTPVNDLPVASAPPVSTLEDTPVSGQIAASDLDGDMLGYAVTTAPTNGSVTVNPDGSYTYTPNANFNGADSFTVTVSDGNGGTAVVTIPVTVTTANDAPVASAPPATTPEDTPVSGQITASDPDGDPLAYAVTIAPTHGSVTVNPDGSYSYTPDANFTGADSFTVTVSDGNGGTVLVTIPVTVTPVNDAPTASALSITTGRDVPVSSQIVAADVDRDPLTYAVTTPPANGTIVINPDGSYTYTPGAGFTGNDSFTVTVSDGNGGTAQVTIPVTVIAVNDAPVATAPPVSTAEDVPVSGQIAASDPNGDPLTYAVTTPPANGVVTVNPDGSYTYTPNADFNGSDSFIVTVSDGNGGTVQVAIPVTVNPANDAPVASAPPVSTAEDTPVSGQIAASDLDGDALGYTVTTAPANGVVTINPDGSYTYTPNANFTGGDSFTVTVSDGNGGTVLVSIPVTVIPVNDAPVAAAPPATTAEDTPVNGQIAASDADGDPLAYAVSIAPTHGVVTINPDGSYTYTPDAGFNGADSFTVTVSDGNGGTVLVTIPVTVTPVNDVPVASAPPATTAEDTPVNGQITASDADGDPLTYAVTTPPANGVVTVNPDGSYTYTPNANFNGPDSFTVTVSDGNGGTALVTIPVTVTPVNDAPVASAPPATTPEDTPVSGQIAASDPDGDPLAYAVTTAPTHGSVTVNPDGSYTYTPNAGFNGADSFTVAVSDGNGGTTLVVIPVTVTAVNDVPVASAPPATTAEDTPVGGQITASDADGDPLTYAVTTPPTNGIVTINPDGSYTYTPNANFNGADSFTVTVSDGNGGTALVTIPVTVTPVNDAPVASAPPATTPEDTPVSGQVAASDADGDPLTYAVTTAPTHGSVMLNPDGSYTYTPDANFNGADSFTVTVNDGNGGTTLVVVPVTVTPVNDVPAASAPPATTAEDTPVNGQVTASDADGDPLTYAVTTPPVNGVVTVNPDGSYTYTPNANFNGADSFTVTVSDGNGGTVLVTIPVTVTPVNDAPVASAPPASTTADRPVGGQVTATDVDGDPLTYAVTTAPTHGSVTLNPDGSYVFTPEPGFVGSDSFAVTVSDGNGGTVVVVIPVTVLPANVAPIDGDENVTAPQDAPVTVPVLANASDADGDPLTVIAASASVGSVTINPDGTITFLPPAGFTGTATISYTVSDGRGGETVSQLVVTVVNAGVDMNALLDGGDPFGDEVEPLRPAEPGEYRAPLVVLDAVNGVRSLGGTPIFGSAPPLLTAVNDIDPLNGTRSLTDVSHPINAVVHYLDRFAPFRSDVDRLFENRFDATDIQRPEGFSVRTVGSADHQLVMESIVRGHVIYLELRDEGEADTPPIVEYQLRTRDGRPLPDWIRFDARGLAIIERPADADELRLIAIGIRADGSRIEVPVLIQGATGEIQLDAPVARREVGAAAPLGAVMASAGASSSSETALLLGAFDG